jgi:hypothetical protein
MSTSSGTPVPIVLDQVCKPSQQLTGKCVPRHKVSGKKQLSESDYPYVIPACFWRESRFFEALDPRQKHAGVTGRLAFIQRLRE